jgi:DNA primase
MTPWEEIRLKLNIVDVIGEYLPVRQFGATYKCVCPFHKDKNPSLVISPEKGFWHCFGCGAGGDVFKFVTEYENISKKDALEKLAKKAGVLLQTNFKPKATSLSQSASEVETPEISSFELGYKYLDWTALVYHKLLKKILKDRNHPVTIYCLERHLSEDIIDTFLLGYAPSGNFLGQLAGKHGLSKDLLVEVGLLKKVQTDFKDKFSHRIVIPVWDRFGKVVGYTARVLPGDKGDRPKYLNSPQTDWFNKSSLWYGYHLNQKEIRKQKEVIVVEGNMDVIAAYQSGLKNVLASQGTSFTQNQLLLLKPLQAKIRLAFDNDEAGKVSGRKFYLESTKIGLDVYQVLIPENFKDLDEYLTSLKANNLDPKVELKSISYLEFVLQKLENQLRSTNLEVQKEAITNLLELLAVNDRLTQEHFLDKIAVLTKKSRFALNGEMQKVSKQKPTLNEHKEVQIEVKNNDEVQNAILVAFQNLTAFYVQKKSSLNSGKELLASSLLASFYALLRTIIPTLNTTETFEEYLQNNQSIFDLIMQNQIPEPENLQQNISVYLNSHLHSFSSDQDLQKIWLQTKQLTQQNLWQES